MRRLFHSRYGKSKGAALIIVLGLVVISTALSLAYLTRTTADRQLAHSSYHDTAADLLARTALDIVLASFKQEISNANNAGPVSQLTIQPQQWGGAASIPNLIRRSARDDNNIPLPAVPSLASSVSSTSAAANGRIISPARWNSHYLVPLLDPTGTDSTPVASFVGPDWVMVTNQGPNNAPAPSAVIGRYAFAVYDEGGLINMNLGGYPNYASLSRPTRPGRTLPAKYPSEESEIMLAAFTPNDPCQAPTFTPDHTNVTLATGVQCSLLFNTNHNPTSFGVNFLPSGLTLDSTNGNIYGTPAGPGQWTVTQSASNACGTGFATLHLTVQGFASPDRTPWPVNVARKGTVGFADLTVLPSPGLTAAQVNQLIGWRNYATTQQAGASFNTPAFPADAVREDLYARYFLGAVPPFTTPFTTVPTTVQDGRTDQAVMTRQELIRLQKTIGFSPSLLQYLGTFSREWNRPAPDWPQLNGKLGARWDMNNLALVIPTPWFYPGNHGVGHAYGKQRNTDLAVLFGLVWVPASNDFADPSIRFTDPSYYGHWKYTGALAQNNDPPLQGNNPDFCQIIDYAMNQAVGLPANAPNHLRRTFNTVAAIIDQYDTDDLHDSPSGGSLTGNTITIIDYLNDGNPLNYAYGVEVMSGDDPHQNEDRPPFAPYPRPVPANYAQLSRRFENVGEFGYACSPVFTLANRTLDFASAGSNDRAILDFFTYNTAGNRAGITNLNTRNSQVLGSIIRGAWVQDPGAESTPSPTPAPPTILVSQTDALAAGQAIVQETTNTSPGHGPALTRADVARLAAAAVAAVPNFAGSDQAKETIARALAEVGQARTWNLMIDVIAQTGKYAPGTANLSDPSKFIVQGEKRYWLHIALDRDSGTVLGSQLEEVVE